MMKSFAVTLLVTTATMIGTVHAASQGNLDRYTACMISEAKASLKNDPGDQVAAYDRGARLCRVSYNATDEEVDGMGDYIELKITELAAQASETEELENCWSTAATAYLDRVGVSERNLKEATQSADARCWTEMLKAGQEGREMREYMEVQLYNANKVNEDAQPVLTASPSQRFDFKGIVVGASATPQMVKQKLGVDCGAGYEGMQVCNGTVTIAGVIADMNLVISKTGKVQRISLSFSSKFYEQVEDAMFKKFGKPGVNLTSEVQNGYGAKFIQRELLWGDTPNTVAMMKYANNVTDSFIMFSSAEETAMRSTRDQSSDL